MRFLFGRGGNKTLVRKETTNVQAMSQNKHFLSKEYLFSWMKFETLTTNLTNEK
jgi:hypothetical protein